METLSINTCRLHGSPKMSSSKQASPHHHPRLSRVQTLDLMDDIPLPFHTGKHTINFIAWCSEHELVFKRLLGVLLKCVTKDGYDQFCYLEIRNFSSYEQIETCL